jgi:hypothetical protein
VRNQKSPNKTGQPAAEVMERRTEAKENAKQQRMRRAQNRESVKQALDRVRNAARQRKKERFTTLFHHITIDLLGDCVGGGGSRKARVSCIATLLIGRRLWNQAATGESVRDPSCVEQICQRCEKQPPTKGHAHRAARLDTGGAGEWSRSGTQPAPPPAGDSPKRCARRAVIKAV